MGPGTNGAVDYNVRTQLGKVRIWPGDTFGLSALAYCLTAYGVGSFQLTVLRSSRWIPVVCTMLASAAGVVVFAVVGAVIGQENYLTGHLFTVVFVVALVNSALALLAVRVMRWALAEALPSRVAIR